LAQRLEKIYDGLTEVLSLQKPDVVAIEDIFLGRNPRSALLMGHARGAALLAVARAGYPVREYPTALIKQSVVGRGRASKQQVDFMVTRLLGLAGARLPEDAADALAAALCCIIRRDFPAPNAASGTVSAGGIGEASTPPAATVIPPDRL
jgi:crossover junction endodeoxyribonuclease RuvC